MHSKVDEEKPHGGTWRGGRGGRGGEGVVRGRTGLRWRVLQGQDSSSRSAKLTHGAPPRLRSSVFSHQTFFRQYSIGHPQLGVSTELRDTSSGRLYRAVERSNKHTKTSSTIFNDASHTAMSWFIPPCRFIPPCPFMPERKKSARIAPFPLCDHTKKKQMCKKTLRGLLTRPLRTWQAQRTHRLPSGAP